MKRTFSTLFGLLGFLAPVLAFASESVEKELTNPPRDMFTLKLFALAAFIALGTVVLTRKSGPKGI